MQLAEMREYQAEANGQRNPHSSCFPFFGDFDQKVLLHTDLDGLGVAACLRRPHSRLR